jgi:F0F1-type ATP synthase delta subunit
MTKLSRRKVAMHVAKEIAEGNQDIVRQLAAYLIQNKLSSLVGLYVRDIRHYLIDLGVVGVEIESAVDIDDSLRRQIEAVLKDHYNAKTVSVASVENQELLGGLRLQTADSVLDTSLQSRLKKLRTIA